MWPSDENLRPFLDVIGNAQAIAINRAFGLSRPHLPYDVSNHYTVFYHHCAEHWEGHPGRLIQERSLPGGEFPLNKIQLWAKPQANGSAALFVLNYTPLAANYSIGLASITFNGTAAFSDKVAAAVRDVWRHTENGTVAAGGALVVQVPAYDSALLLLSPAEDLARSSYT